MSGNLRLGVPLRGMPTPPARQSFDWSGSSAQDWISQAEVIEYDVPFGTLITDGPTQAGDAILNQSLYAAGCNKAPTVVRFYRDATILYDYNLAFPGQADSTAGNVATHSLAIPAWPRAATYKWTWYTNCASSGGGNGNWGFFSTRKRIWIPPRHRGVGVPG